MIVTRGLGSSLTRGALVAFGLGKTRVFILDCSKRVIVVPAYVPIEVAELSRIIMLEDNAMDRVIDVLTMDDYIELDYADRDLVLDLCPHSIVVDTTQRTIILPEED